MVFVLFESHQKTNKAVDHGIDSSSKRRKHVVGGEEDHLHPSWIASKHKKAQELYHLSKMNNVH